MKRKVAWLILAIITLLALSWLSVAKRGLADFVSAVHEIQSLLRIEEVKLVKTDRVRVNFELLLENPRAHEIRLEAISYMLYVNEQYAGHYGREYDQHLRAGLNQLTQELELAPIYQEVLKAELERSEINLSIRGEVRLSFRLPSAEIEVPIRFIYPVGEKTSAALSPAPGAGA